MFEEGTSLGALWQCVLSSHIKWVLEIEERLGVKITVSLSPPCQSFAYGGITGENAQLARDEMWQCEDYLSDLHTSIALLQGDSAPAGRRYRDSADLNGRTPWDAIVKSGMHCIEAVLIGPDHRAAEMLASEPRLLAAARYRILDSHDLDSFTPHVRRVVAEADSIIALKAFDEVMNGRL